MFILPINCLHHTFILPVYCLYNTLLTPDVHLTDTLLTPHVHFTDALLIQYITPDVHFTCTLLTPHVHFTDTLLTQYIIYTTRSFDHFRKSFHHLGLAVVWDVHQSLPQGLDDRYVDDGIEDWMIGMLMTALRTG